MCCQHASVFRDELGAELASEIWFLRVLVKFMLLSVGFGHDFAAFGALVVLAGAGDLVQAVLGQLNLFLAHATSLGLDDDFRLGRMILI